MKAISEKVQYNAGLYVRLSNERIDDELKRKYLEEGNTDEDYKKELESGSITNQKRFLTKFCNDHNINIFKIYQDDGFSGASFNRPGFQKMLKDIENKKINMVITKDLSRLARLTKVTDFTDEYFPSHNIRYIAVADGIDTGIQKDSLDDMTQFKAFFNEWFLRDTSKKVRNGKKTKALDGKVMTTYCSYGYKKDPNDKNHYIIDEDVAPIIRKMFELGKEGKSPFAIAKILTEKHYPTPSQEVGNVHTITSTGKDGIWAPASIRRILMNEIYIGTVINGKRRKVSYKSKKLMKIPKDEWVKVENQHDPIIDKETFEIVQEQIRKRSSKRNRKFDWLLNGLVYCEECGKKLSIAPGKIKKDGSLSLYTRCPSYGFNPALKLCTNHCNNISKLTDEILNKIRETCTKFIEQENYQNLAIKTKNTYENKYNYKKLELNQLKRKIEFVNKKIDSLYDDKCNGIINEDDFNRMYQKARIEQETYSDRIKILESSIDKSISNEDVLKIVKDFTKLDKITSEMLVRLVNKITISEDKEIKIYYKFSVLNELNEETKNLVAYVS